MPVFKKNTHNFLFLGIFILFMCQGAIAQVPDDVEMENLNNDVPLDGLVERSPRRILPYDHVREADIMWEKRIWRVIDIREKMNLPFGYPERPFFSILMDGATDGSLTAYSTEDDKFTSPLTPEEVASMGATVDTVITFDPETYEEQIQVVRNDLNPEDVKRFRMKEIWFFDEETSTMQVRILGLAPLIDVKDENGNFRYEKPMFWIYYPEARKVLADERVFNPGNDASPNTWEDLLEMRFFSSYIYKESNILNRRLQDYLSGVDLLQEADKIKQAIFNYEHDLWSY